MDMKYTIKRCGIHYDELLGTTREHKRKKKTKEVRRWKRWGEGRFC
jgi:hypothetical protein